MTADMTDAALVRRVREGDSGAFDALVVRYFDACARYAFRMLGDRHDAEDAVQETMLRAYRFLGSYEERDVFRAWLYRILVNECRTLAGRRRRRERSLTRDDAGVHDAVDERAWAAAGTSGMRDELQRVLDGMEPLLREAFLLKYIEDRSYDEMAAITGAGVSALKMRVKRACDWLRPRLEVMYGGLR